MLCVGFRIQAVHLIVIHHSFRCERMISTVLHAAIDRAVFTEIVAINVFRAAAVVTGRRRVIAYQNIVRWLRWWIWRVDDASQVECLGIELTTLRPFPARFLIVYWYLKWKL